jgi:hypothetical protein
MSEEELEEWLSEESARVDTEGLVYYHVSKEGLAALLEKLKGEKS